MEKGISVYGTMGANQTVLLGGVKPLPPDYVGRPPVGHSHLIVWPCLLFVASLLSFTWLYITHSTILIMTVAFSSCYLIVISTTGDSRARSLVAFVSLLAILFGAGIGWYTHEKRVQFWYGLHYGERYSNVVPTQLASAHADAAVIGFASGTYVDTENSAGYKSVGAAGHEFCAAPIIEDDFKGEVQYFAVGRDCCDDRAGFWCDGTGTKDTAHSGVVVHDYGALTSRADHYMDAVRLTVATWDIVSVPNPLIVRWVADANIDSTIDEWKWSGIYMNAGSSVFGLTFVYILMSVGLNAVYAGGSVELD
jgi:hypothetical protein